MRRGSSSTIEINAPNNIEADIDKVYVIANQKGLTIKKEGTLEKGIAKVTYDAKETMKFASGRLFLQVQIETKDGNIFQSDVTTYNISDTLDKGEEIHGRSNNGFDIRYPY